MTCPECTDEADALESIASSYMRAVNNTSPSTPTGSRARVAAFYAFRLYVVYGADMALASLSSDPSDVVFYHRLASTALKAARIRARKAATLLHLSTYP